MFECTLDINFRPLFEAVIFATKGKSANPGENRQPTDKQRKEGTKNTRIIFHGYGLRCVYHSLIMSRPTFSPCPFAMLSSVTKNNPIFHSLPHSPHPRALFGNHSLKQDANHHSAPTHPQCKS